MQGSTHIVNDVLKETEMHVKVRPCSRSADRRARPSAQASDLLSRSPRSTARRTASAESSSRPSQRASPTSPTRATSSTSRPKATCSTLESWCVLLALLLRRPLAPRFLELTLSFLSLSADCTMPDRLRPRRRAPRLVVARRRRRLEPGLEPLLRMAYGVRRRVVSRLRQDGHRCVLLPLSRPRRSAQADALLAALPLPTARTDLLEQTLAKSPVSAQRLDELARIFVKATELEIAFWDAAVVAGDKTRAQVLSHEGLPV